MKRKYKHKALGENDVDIKQCNFKNNFNCFGETA